ncbi:MAG: hypothetical protein JKX81_11585 [Arenicella sp.]|nr:hypothetical protein [Arenicella sp.]
MKVYQIIFFIIALVMLNNVMLLFYIGHFSKDQTLGSDVKEIISATATVAPTSSNQPLATIDLIQRPTTVESEIEEIDSAELAQAVENYIDSDQFLVVLEAWQKNARQRNNDLSMRMSKWGAANFTLWFSKRKAVARGSPLLVRFFKAVNSNSCQIKS